VSCAADIWERLSLALKFVGMLVLLAVVFPFWLAAVVLTALASPLDIFVWVLTGKRLFSRWFEELTATT